MSSAKRSEVNKETLKGSQLLLQEDFLEYVSWDMRQEIQLNEITLIS